MSKKLTYQQVIDYIEYLGYILIDNIYINNSTKLSLKDKEGYFYYTTLNDLKNGYKPRIVHTSNPYSLNNIELFLKLNYTVKYTIISKNYNGNNSKLTLYDNEGYYYISSWASIQLCKNPLKFYIYNPYTIQNIKLWLKLNNKTFELLSNTYENIINDLQWKCLKDKEIWDANLNSILNGGGCPYCHGKQVGLSNCLATKNPELSKEWHSTKNGDLTPYDVTKYSSEYVWWQCKNNYKHEWPSTIANRMSGNGCPYCAGKLSSEDYNLLVINPELCKEWNYEINDKLPENYTPGSNEKVWWKCKECDHEWPATINSRNGLNSGCPECNESKGEKKINEILINKSFIKISQEEFDNLFNKDKYNKNYFIPQMKYEGLLGTGGGLLSYDFYIPNSNLLIEYDGEFHYKAIKLYKNEPMKDAEDRLKKQQIHDKIKDKYAHNHNIKLLRIPYWDFNNIEQILSKELDL